MKNLRQVIMIVVIMLVLVLLVLATGATVAVGSTDDSFNSVLQQVREASVADRASESRGDTGRSTPQRISSISPTTEQCNSFSTEQLLQLSLEQPFYGILVAYSQPSGGIDMIAENFVPLRLLIEREDALAVVQKYERKFAENAHLKTYFLDSLEVFLQNKAL